MNIKKIVFMLPSLKTGGGNRMVIELSNRLVIKGISVDIIFPNNSQDKNTFSVSENINFISVGKYSKKMKNKLINQIKTFFYINNNYSDTIIVVTDPIMAILIPIIKNNKVARFVQADDYRIFDDLFLLKNKFFLLVYKVLTKMSYNYRIKYFFNSKFTFDKFIELSKLRDIDFKLVHPAINHDFFYNKNIRNPNFRNICLVARKHPWKGFDDFSNICNNLESLKLDNIYIISHDDLSQFDLTGMTLIKPKSDDDISYYMNKSQIFISTSWWEGFGLPPLEAMSCGCCLITSNSGGVNEYINPDVNCKIYESKDVEKLNELIVELVNNLDLQRELSANAQRKSKEFSWEKSTEQLLKVLES